ncbi:condensation domain-containing protein [Echinicola jeungdonensis]|uniref:condensation domain-containing protein n=1 Tax=Echinicola jeungdonensis TaxID=709343 RepID=UPI00338D92B8
MSSQHQVHYLLVNAHHTVADGWSLGVFLNELISFYKANVKGENVQLIDLPIQYADFAIGKNSKAAQHEASFPYHIGKNN